MNLLSAFFWLIDISTAKYIKFRSCHSTVKKKKIKNRKEKYNNSFVNDDNAGTVNFQCDGSASPPPPPAPMVPPPGDLAKYYIHPFIYHT